MCQAACPPSSPRPSAAPQLSCRLTPVQLCWPPAACSPARTGCSEPSQRPGGGWSKGQEERSCGSPELSTGSKVPPARWGSPELSTGTTPAGPGGQVRSHSSAALGPAAQEQPQASLLLLLCRHPRSSRSRRDEGAAELLPMCKQRSRGTQPPSPSARSPGHSSTHPAHAACHCLWAASPPAERSAPSPAACCLRCPEQPAWG